MLRRVALLHLAAAAVLMAALASVGVQAVELQLEPSSHECPASAVLPGARPKFYRTCTFRNLYLWQGTAYYIHEGAAPDIGSLGIRFEIWSRHEDDDAVLEFVQPVTAPAFRKLLAVTAPKGQAAPAAADATIPLAAFWKPRKIWPASLSDRCATGTGPGRANYYHFFGEWLPVLGFTLCEQFGHCHYANRSQLTIIDVFRRYRCHERERYPQYYQEAVSCVSAQPLRHLRGPLLSSQLTHVKAAWMGLSPRCRGVPPGCYKEGSGRLPPTPRLTAAWRDLLGQCFGTDAAAPAALEPLQLLVIDRLYASGRHLVNVNTLMRALEARYSEEHVKLRLVYMEGLSLKQQAALWSSASVVVHVHGASLANYYMLPRHATVVQLAPMLGHYKPQWYTDYLQEELRGVSDIEVETWLVRDDPWLGHLSTEAIARQVPFKPPLAALVANRTAFGHIVRTYTCPKWLGRRAAFVCEEVLLRNLNVNMPVDVALNLTDAAIVRAYEKQGRAVPPGLLRAAAAAALVAGAADGSSAAAVAQSSNSSTGGVSGSSNSSSSSSQHLSSVATQLQQPEGVAVAGSSLGAAPPLPRLQLQDGMRVLLVGVTAGAAVALAVDAVLRRRERAGHRRPWG